jgi:hypothetical protein
MELARTVPPQIRVKILNRRHAPEIKVPTSLLSRFAASAKNTFGNIAAHFSGPPARGKQKLGFDPSEAIDPSTIVGKVQNLLLPLVGYVDSGVLRQMLSKMKVPLIAAVGIASVAGLAYLAYRLWESRQEHSGVTQQEKTTAQIFMEDLRKSAPDLFKIEGWQDTVARHVTEIIRTADAADLVAKLAKLKEEVLEQQSKIGPPQHGGGFMLKRLTSVRRHGHGGGIAAPLY